MADVKGPSRGRKQCPACQEYVGVRLQKCTCGHEFSKKEVAEASSPAPKPEVNTTAPTQKIRTEGAGKAGFDYYAPHLDRGVPGAYYIITPSGKPPVELKDFSETGIKQWADKVAQISAQQNYHLSKEAVVYYARTCHRFDKDSEAKEKLVKEAIYGN